MVVGLGPGDVVFDGNPDPTTERGTAAPHISAHIALAWLPISAAAEHLFNSAVKQKYIILRFKTPPPGAWGSEAVALLRLS